MYYFIYLFNLFIKIQKGIQIKIITNNKMSHKLLVILYLNVFIIVLLWFFDCVLINLQIKKLKQWMSHIQYH